MITVLAPPGSLIPGTILELDETEAHHLKVRRVGGDAAVRMVDGSGAVAEGRVRLSRNRAEAVIDGVARVERPVGLTLALGAGDRDRFALVVEKAVELGATDVVPLEVERAMAVGSRLRPNHLDGLRRRSREAMKQCGSAWAVNLHDPRSLEDFLAEPRSGAFWLAHLQGSAEPRLGPSEPVTIVVGPEGGLTEAEVEKLLSRKFSPIALGPHTLRFETAALAALAVVWQVRLRGAHD